MFVEVLKPCMMWSLEKLAIKKSMQDGQDVQNGPLLQPKKQFLVEA